MFIIVWLLLIFFFFFFQAEDGIRDYKVTGVQTCALPISLVYIGILGGILVLLYFIVFTAMVQLVQIAQQLQRNLPRFLNDLKPFLERKIGRASCRERV